MNIPIRHEPGQEDNVLPIWIAASKAEIGLQRESRVMNLRRHKASYVRMLKKIEATEKKYQANRKNKPFSTEGSDEAYENWKADQDAWDDERSY